MFTRKRRVAIWLSGITVLASAMGTSHVAMAEETPLIPRSVLFGDPDRSSVKLSPDGKHISFLAPFNGALNVWVGPTDNPSAARVITKDTHRGIRRYFWAYTNNHVIYLQDKNGDENFHAFSVDLGSGKIKSLTPFEGARALIQEVSPDYPDEILVGVNNRDRKVFDIHRIHIATGAISLVTQNNEGFFPFISDDDMKLHVAQKATADGGSEVYRATEDNSWTLLTEIPYSDNTTSRPIMLDETRRNLFMIDSRGRNTAALTLLNLETGTSRIVAQDHEADIIDFLGHPTKNVIRAVQSTFERRKWQILDYTLQKDMDYLETVADGEFVITDQTLDDNKWIVEYEMDNGPVRYFLYDRSNKRARFLFTNRKDLEGVELASMHVRTIKSRDGMNLVSYLTLPTWTVVDRDGRPEKPLPMILLVHGGPWRRDNWGYHSGHQWLGNRGYAVLSVNFRGSTGFGKDFVNASSLEWSGKMHDDLIDAVDWAIKQGIADKDRVGIMGGSYGGYATLVGLTFTPERFACGVDTAGPSSLLTLVKSFPPYWAPAIELYAKRVGDYRTEEGHRHLLKCSPLVHVDSIIKPLLIGQGANDVRVTQAEAEQIVDAMKARNIPVTYVLYPDEGHGFARPENRSSFLAVAESFLAQHLGGRFEPIGEEDIEHSSIVIPHGAENIPGLPRGIKTQ